MLALCETVAVPPGRSCSPTSASTATPCGNCDTCLTPPESWDGTIAGAEAAVHGATGCSASAARSSAPARSIDILLGKTHRQGRASSGTTQLTVFGVGTELRDAEWRGVVRQLLAQGLLAVEGDYGTLVLTEASAEVLGRRREVHDAPRAGAAGARRGPRAAATAAAAPTCRRRRPPVFERLRAWRGAAAKEQGVPAYVIFHDATLRQIATERPTTLAELGTISGVGENKLAKYGDAVLAVLDPDATADEPGPADLFADDPEA